jgi:hypothetical protein
LFWELNPFPQRCGNGFGKDFFWVVVRSRIVGRIVAGTDLKFFCCVNIRSRSVAGTEFLWQGT